MEYMMIKAKQLALIYSDGTLGLEPVDLSIEAGELVIITGPSGSGKTTLLKLLIGNLYPTSGSLEVLGQAIEKRNSKHIQKMRHRMGPVFQEFRLIKGKSALENVILGMRFLGIKPKDMMTNAKNALIRVGLEEKFDAPIEKLSWGESQRVAIARAVARNPQLIIADEPTGNLDEANAINVLELLTSFRSPTTSVILTTHATHLIQGHDEATRIYMERGAIRIERPASE
jgi:cell division transport system ATP-binding protein